MDFKNILNKGCVLMYYISLEDKESFKKALLFIKPYKKHIICLYVVTILSSVFELLPMYVFGKIIDYTINKNFQNIINNIFLLFIIFVITSILSFVETYLTTLLNNKITYSIKEKIFYKIEQLTINEFNKFRIGDFISRLEGDTANISKFYIEDILNVILSFLKFIVAIFFIFKISVSLSIVSICTFPISILIYYLFSKKNKEYVKIGRKLSDNNYSFIQEVFSSIREIKSLTIENKLFDEYKILLNKIQYNNIKVSFLSMYASLVYLLVSNISEWIIIGYGCWLIIHNKFSIGSYVSFNSYLKIFLTSLKEISSINITIQKVSVSFTRIYEILGTEIEEYTLNYKDSSNLINGELTLNNVAFSYAESNKKVLNNISCNIKANSISAFVGTSGCGKSTLFDLIVNFYKCNDGDIYIDQKNIKDINLTSLRKNIAYVQQEPFIFNATIKDNLLLGNLTAGMEEIVYACKAAGIHSFIEDLPNKYDTLLNERGGKLSGGQKQRLAVARAILKKSKIILLDESTSALDGKCERELVGNLINLSKNHTIIIIAHRLTTVIDIPNIYVFDKGRLDNVGNHEFLINNCNVYKHLYGN